MFKQFDIVRLKTTKRIRWMSGSGNKPSPHGEWSVVGSIGVFLILCKDYTLIKVPFEDVVKVGNYRLEKLFEAKEKKDGKEQERKRDPNNDR
jgi:hypothetical protein